MNLRSTLEQDLARLLDGAGRIAVVGIGDELQPADRLGMSAAREIDALRLPGVAVFLAGTLPESFTAPVRRFRPDHILLIDAAEMGLRPGAVACIDGADVKGARLSTHALPLSVLMEYLRENVRVPVTLFGIQPEREAAGPAPTPAEESGLARLVCALQRVLGPARRNARHLARRRQ